MSPATGHDRDAEPDAEEAAVWVGTEPTIDGTGYVATLEVDDDHALVLTREAAAGYATGVLAAVARAEYDAAVLRQLAALGIEQPAIAELVGRLRADRPPLEEKATAPLGLEPGVTSAGKPFLVVLVHGERVGQWEVDDACEHAQGVLEAALVAELDAGYYQALHGVIGLDEDTSRHAVTDLHNWREATE